MFNYELKENGICELMTIGNKEYVSVNENCSNHKNFTRHSGFELFDTEQPFEASRSRS